MLKSTKDDSKPRREDRAGIKRRTKQKRSRRVGVASKEPHMQEVVDGSTRA
jgi:hypothetical protein